MKAYKYSIVYSSRTGNTEFLARAIREALPQESCEYFGPAERRALKSSLLFIGFWTDKGACDSDTSLFLNAVHNKRIFLFGTAGFSGNDSYYAAILTQVKELIDPSNRILGAFLCQGKMPAPVRRRYEELLRQNPGDSKVRQLLENFDRAADHPNAADCEALLRCVEQALKKF